MNLIILDQNLNAVTVIDTYESFIWTDRYYKCGDFELYTPMNTDVLNYIKQDYYIVNENSEHIMVIEKILIQSDIEEGSHLTVTGRSVESILDRRIIWGQKTISGNLQKGIRSLLSENVISPNDSKRRLKNFIFQMSTDEAITSLTIDAQFTGDNLYDALCDICEAYQIGFRATLTDDKKFLIQLYAGQDRSYNQTDLPYVVFSPTFDNIINSNYVESKASYKNVTLVGGEGEGSDRRYITAGDTTVTGMDRRELFTDARDVSSQVDGETISDTEYNAQLTERGEKNLKDYPDLCSFEGETENSVMYGYNKDFFIGDIVEIEDEYGHESSVRIVEFVQSENNEGISTYPTFENIS